jgi:iron complex transport system substrate-binding protein
MDWKKFKHFGMLVMVLLLAIALISGCGAAKNLDGESSNDPEVELGQAPVEEVTEPEPEPEPEVVSHYPVTVIDGAGREVTIEEKPETVVSFISSNTEVLFALGLDEEIIGVSDYCNYPEAALEKTKLGARDMNSELVLELLPDVAFVQDYHFNNKEEVLNLYTEAGIKVIVIGSAASFEDTYASIELVADVVGVPENAEEIVSGMKQSLAEIKEKAQQITDKKKVWIEVSPAPDIFTTGTGTFMHEMLASIQAINVAAEQEGWVKLTEEEIVQLNPDVIITTYGYYVDNPAEGVLARDGWGEIPAIKNKQVFDVDSDTVTRSGPRLIDGVEALAKFIYPEIFK